MSMCEQFEIAQLLKKIDALNAELTGLTKERNELLWKDKTHSCSFNKDLEYAIRFEMSEKELTESRQEAIEYRDFVEEEHSTHWTQSTKFPCCALLKKWSKEK